MRRAVLLAPMICLAFLSACGGSAKLEESFSLWREEFVAVESRSIEAEVTAISQESEAVFTLRCESGGQGESVEIMLPEYLAGVSAHTDGESAELEYDGAVLAMGDAAIDRCSPMRALPLMLGILREGYVQRVWTESAEDAEYLVTELEDAESRRMTVWLEMSNLQPRFAAIRSGDETELKINILKME